MKIVVQLSGGKDSQASAIWAVNKWGSDVIAQFSDTKWDDERLYDHLEYITSNLGIELLKLSSKKYDGMIDLAKQKKRFPATKSRYCTTELKVIPFIDWVLQQNENLFIIQGIRANESKKRSKMDAECRLFRYYFEPYQSNSMIIDDLSLRTNLSLNQKRKLKKAIERKEQGFEDEKYYTYRKNDVFAWCEKYDDSIFRPVFIWTAQEVIDYILDNNQMPNILYSEGASRVGCDPCIMSNLGELKASFYYRPEIKEKIRKAEKEANSSFFPRGYIPDWACSGKAPNGKPFPWIDDVINYLEGSTIDMFKETEPKGCFSHFGLCDTN